MRIFEIKHLSATDTRGERLRVSELDKDRKFPVKTYGYNYNVRSCEINQWAVARYLGLETYDDPMVARSILKKTGNGKYLLIIEFV